MTKIDVVSGFLGAGKTTLIKKLLQEALDGSKTVLIENEFGEIGIDGGFLKEAGIEIKEMNSGCICCSLVGDFGASLKEVIETYAPERILIEPSGVGKLSDVLRAVEDVAADLDVQVNSAVAVVDASKAKMYIKNFGEFFINQIEYAGTIILSRTDKANQDKIEESVKILRGINEKSPIITTPIAQLSGEKMLEIMEGSKSLEEELLSELRCPECGEIHEHGEECGCGHDHHHHHDAHSHEGEHHHEDHSHGHAHGGEDDHSHHHVEGHEEHHHHDHHHDECHAGHDHHHHHHGHHHADDVFTSWGRETVKSYTKEEISSILQALEKEETYGTILRAKGMVAGADGQWIYFDMVPGEQEVRSGTAEYTGRICVIGSKLKEEKLAELFGL